MTFPPACFQLPLDGIHTSRCYLSLGLTWEGELCVTIWLSPAALLPPAGPSWRRQPARGRKRYHSADQTPGVSHSSAPAWQRDQNRMGMSASAANRRVASAVGGPLDAAIGRMAGRRCLLSIAVLSAGRRVGVSRRHGLIVCRRASPGCVRRAGSWLRPGSGSPPLPHR